MRIAYIDVNCKHSSTGKIVYDLYTQSRADGHTAAVCYGRGPVVEEEQIYKFGLDWETRFHALMTRLTGWTGCFSPLSTRRLIRFLDAFRPDMVHIHELHAYFVNLKPLLRYLAKHRIPVVHTLHCEFSYTGKCGYAYECENWKHQCEKCPHLRDYPKTLWFDHTAAMQKEKKQLFSALDKLVITAPSGWLAERAKQSFLRNREIDVVHNGIDTAEVFHPQPCAHLREKYRIGPEEKVVLAVAPDLMSQRKGGRWVLKLAQAMEQEKIRFVLVGVSDLSEPFPANVTAVGLLKDQKELAAYYSLADCFVICSEKENFPTTCLESFCCGTPVAGFAAGGTAETVPAPYGQFCEYGNVHLLAQAIRTQLSLSCPRAEISSAGIEHYSQQSMYLQYMEIFYRLCEEKPK